MHNSQNHQFGRLQITYLRIFQVDATIDFTHFAQFVWVFEIMFPRNCFICLHEMSKFVKVQTLPNLSDCNAVSAKTFAMLPKLTSLTSLTFPKLCDETFLDLKSCPKISRNLKQLIMTNSPLHTHYTVQIIRREWILTHLTLSQCPQMSDEVLKHIGQSCGISLQYINIDDSPCFTDVGLVSLVSVARNIEVFSAKFSSNHGGITDQSLKQLAMCKGIRELKLRCCTVTNEGLEFLLKEQVSSLRILFIELCTSVFSAQSLSLCTNLLQLKLDGCPISLNNIFSILSSTTQLQMLSLASLPVTHQVLKPIYQYPSLTALNLSGTHVDDKTVKNIAKNRNLRILCLSQTKLITGACLSTLATCCTNLQVLDTRNTNISFHDYMMLREQLPHTFLNDWKEKSCPPLSGSTSYSSGII
eukprot:TRINITY_DN7916_c0_g1_i5.p1 TRINITY_DN7916_c0_g1~~TRINITY_DN7916_c0_g1_i5.p1  ORF type:complete len:415 (-),score=66.97 TRINITY_DN7916_c0_g1_i5:70-1314(-)